MKAAKKRKLIKVLNQLIPLLEKCGGPGSGVPGPCPSGVSKPKSSPLAPPKVGPADVQAKMNALHEAAKSGDIKKLEAIKTNPNAVSPYPKKLHEYKMQLLKEMEAGHKITGESVPIPKDAKPFEEPPKPVPLKETVKALSEAPKVSAGTAKKIGHWVVQGESGMKPGILPGMKYSKAEEEELWNKGKALAEKAGISEEVTNYTGAGYREMNARLRSGDLSSEESKAALKISKTIVDEGVILPPGAMLTRGHYKVSFDEWSKVTPGTIISDRGLLSTTTQSQESWAGLTVLNLTVGRGVKALPARHLSAHAPEDEIIFAPNQRLFVTRVEKGKQKKDPGTIVHAIILPTLDSQCCPP